jgi:hypothetical protein
MLLELISYTDAPLPKKVEVRVYALNINKINTLLSDPEFQDLAEDEGRVYSLEGFQEAFNRADIDSNLNLIRIINVQI